MEGQERLKRKDVLENKPEGERGERRGRNGGRK